MNKKSFPQLLFILCILALTFSINGCLKSEIRDYTPVERVNGDEYKTFITIEESLLHFSFEYPSYYWLVDEAQRNVNPSLNVGLNGETRDEFFNGIVKSIDIHITNYSPKWLGFPNAESAVKKHISEYKWSFFRHYRLLEKHQAVVDGIEGWETITTFRERRSLPFGHGTPRDPTFIIARDLFFDFKGMTWQFSLYTDRDSYAKQTKADFEHILSTFKFSK